MTAIANRFFRAFAPARAGGGARSWRALGLAAAYGLGALAVVAFARDHADRPAASSIEGVSSPAEVPPKGWVEVARGVWTRIGENRVLAVAAGLVFYGLLAIFPAISALVSIFGLFADPAVIHDRLAGLAGVLPGGAISVIGDQVNALTAQGRSALSFGLVTGVAIALWSANAGMKALFDGLNVAYEVEETRGFFRLNAVSLLFTMSGLLLALVAVSATVVAPWVLQHAFDDHAGAAKALRWAGAPLGVALAILTLAVLYRFGPARIKPAWRWVTPGSVFATATLVVATLAFSFYADHFGSYNKTYGALGAVIGFMTWLWIASIVVLVGAEINAEVESAAKGAPTAR